MRRKRYDKKSQNLIYINSLHRIHLCISLPNCQTDGEDIYKIDAHSDEFSQKTRFFSLLHILPPPLSWLLLQIETYFFSGGSCVFLKKFTFSSHGGQTAP